jgi:hypothetical protein
MGGCHLGSRIAAAYVFLTLNELLCLIDQQVSPWPGFIVVLPVVESSVVVVSLLEVVVKS